MKLRHFATPFLLAALSPLAISATDGSLGTSSQGTTDIDIAIGDFVQISGMSDIDLGAATAGSASTGNTGACIYRNSDDDVDVTFTSSVDTANGNTGAFRMENSDTAGVFLPYSVSLTGASTNLVGVGSGGTASTISDEDNSSSSCGGGSSHTLSVTVSATTIDTAEVGAYADTITVLVAPN